MKRFFTITVVTALFVGLLLSSCNNNSNANKLIGKWVLIQEVYKYDGEIESYTYDVADEVYVLIFRADGTFSFCEDGDCESATYTHKGNQLSLLAGFISKNYTVKELTSSTLIVEYLDFFYNETVIETYVKVQ